MLKLLGPAAIAAVLAVGASGVSQTPQATPPAAPSAPIGPVTVLTSPAPPGSSSPNLTADRRGRVWMSWIESAGGKMKRVKIAALTGTEWSTPLTIAEGETILANWADVPSVFVAASGQMAVHWLEQIPGPEADFTHVRLSSDDGRTWTEPMSPHKDQSASQHGFVSFFDAAGTGLGLVWLDGRDAGAHGAGHTGGNMTLRATTLSAQGAGEEWLVDDRVCDCCPTAAARTSEGVVAAYRDRSAGEIRDISVVRFAGGHWSEPVTVHADGWQINGCPVNGPAIAALDRSVAVAWFTGGGMAPHVNVAFSLDAGRSFLGATSLDGDAALGRVSVVMAAADQALVGSVERSTEGARLLVRRVRRDGDVSAPALVTPVGAERASGFPRMVLVGRRVVFAWTDVKAGSPPQIRVADARLQ